MVTVLCSKQQEIRELRRHAAWRNCCRRILTDLSLSQAKRRFPADIPMDAVVCYNDQIAVEVIRTLREFGKKVPRDVSVTGFDNSLLAKDNHIPITTISHPQDKLGRMAAELLLRLIRGEALTEEELHIRVEPEIVVRDSTWKR